MDLERLKFYCKKKSKKFLEHNANLSLENSLTLLRNHKKE